MLVIVSSSPQMWGSLFISTNIPDLQSGGPRTVELFSDECVSKAAGLYLDMAALSVCNDAVSRAL